MPEYQRTQRLIQLGFWLAMAFCSYMAFAPPPANPTFHVSDVILHGVSFSVLTFALQLAYLPRRWLMAALCLFAYGAAIEILQGFTPQRTPELKDLLGDVLGIGIGLAGFRLLGAWSLGLARRIIG